MEKMFFLNESSKLACMLVLETTIKVKKISFCSSILLRFFNSPPAHCIMLLLMNYMITLKR